MAKIGIIVTVYNPDERYFRECLESIRNQTLKDIEVLLVDDGSDSQTAEICDEFVEGDRRFKVWHRENEGVSIASNFGIAHVTADYFTFVDHDDKLDLHMCEKVYNEAVKSEAELVIWNYVSFSTQFEKRAYYVGPSRKEYQEDDMQEMRKMILDPMSNEKQQISLLGANWGKLYRTDMIQKCQEIRFPEHIMGGEDALFTLRAFKKVKRAVFIDEYLYFYRQSESSFTKKFRKNMPQEEFELAKRYENEFKDENAENVIKKYYCNLFIALIINYLLHEQNPQSKAEKKEEIRQWLSKEEMQDAVNDYKTCGFGMKKNLFFMLAKKNRLNMLMLLAMFYKKMISEERDT